MKIGKSIFWNLCGTAELNFADLSSVDLSGNIRVRILTPEESGVTGQLKTYYLCITGDKPQRIGWCDTPHVSCPQLVEWRDTLLRRMVHNAKTSEEARSWATLQLLDRIALVDSRTSGDSKSKYEIRRGKDGVVFCSCPAWRFSKKHPKVCKHILSMTEKESK